MIFVNNIQQQQYYNNKQRQQCWSIVGGYGKTIMISSLVVLIIQLQLLGQQQCTFVTARAVLGVDLGSLYMKVALVQSGSPLEIVTNLHSKRKTEQLVLFDNDSRFYGADAAALLARKSHITPAAMSIMLGRDENHPTVQVLAERHYPIRPVYNESRSGVLLKVDGQDFTPEELVAMVLSHAVDISVAYSLESGSTAIAPPKDIVLTVPSFSTQKERQALLDAAELAGLNVLTLIDETTAAALHYAMDKNFENEKEQTLLFYNMGGSCLQVSLIRFFNYMQPQRYGAAKSTPALEVLAKSWDTTLGGDAVDNIIVEMIATEFNNKWSKHIADPTKNDVRNFARPMTKIRLQANKVKHVLSANLEIPIHLDSVHDDLSVSMSITRDMLEEKLLSSGMIQRAIQPVLDVLKIANKTMAEINGTELLGGGMRVPIIQSELQKVLGTDEPLGLHINADESFALGAAFAGANISTAFRVRQVGMTDIQTFPIQVTLKDASEDDSEKKGFFGMKKKKKYDSAATAGATDDDSWMKQAVIFKSMGKLGTKKTIAFTHDKDVECALDYITEDDTTNNKSSMLPPGTELPLERYSLKGIVEFVKDMTDKKLLNETNPKPKVSLQFELSASGIAQLVKAEVAVEETYIAQETIEVDDDTPDDDTNTTTASTDANTTSTTTVTDDTNATAANASTADANATTADANATTAADANATKTKKTKPIIKKKKKITVEKEKKRVHRKTLEVTKYYEGRVKPHSPELLAASKIKLYEMAQRDKERMLLQEAKNKVESYIYKIKNKLVDDEDAVASVTTVEQREEVQKLSVDAESWLEDDGYDANITVMEAKFIEISTPMEKILFRLDQKTALPVALKGLEKQLNDTVNLMTLWETSKPHITIDERTMILKQVEDVREWVIEKQANQTAVQPHEDPVFTTADIPQRTQLLETLVVALSKKPIPKVPKKKKTTNSTDTNSTDSNRTDSSSTTDANATSVNDDSNSTTTTAESNTTNTTTADASDSTGNGDGDEL